LFLRWGLRQYMHVPQLGCEQNGQSTIRQVLKCCTLRTFLLFLSFCSSSIGPVSPDNPCQQIFLVKGIVSRDGLSTVLKRQGAAQ
jgi:hypothetical protein